MSPSAIRDDYRESLALGGSDLRGMVKDFEAWHYLRKHRLAGTTPPWLQEGSTPSQELGTLIHLGILEPWQYDANAVIIPYHDSYATKAGRDAKAQAEAEAKTKGGFTVREEHHAMILELREGVSRILPPIKHGQTERAFFRQIAGHECKGKLDYLSGDLLIDLKSCSDWHRREAVMQQEHYAVQLAHYAAVAAMSRSWAIVWAETKPPFRVELQIINNTSFYAETHRLALDKYTQALKPSSPRKF